jgi:thiosulfate/3-mercaptopyruvate sulfurtransferase
VAAADPVLISAAALADLAGLLTSASGAVGASGPAGAVTLLDVRWRLGGPPGIDAYRAGHLPGAVFADLDAVLAAPPGPGGRHPLPSAEDFQAAMRRAGVRERSTVVVYDDADSTAAARAWWLLLYFGHEAVRVLDGGYRSWISAALPVEPGTPPSPAAGDFTARPGHLPLLAAAQAAARARTGVLLDARAGERYRGETEPVDPVAGHIPGAVSAPTAQNVNPDGTFKSPAALAARFASLGIAAATEPDPAAAGTDAAGTGTGGTDTGGAGGAPGAVAVGAYCGSGVTAAHEVLALRLAGIPAALYAGSWSEWITDPGRPVATGEAAG